jgi:3-phosphoshikimate 1-carboxyvinyltransferase
VHGRALQALGCPIAKTGGVWEVLGRGVGGLEAPMGDLDFGNAGTGARLMMGVIAGHDITVRMTGDASLSRRPMGRVLKPLRQMGLEVLDGADHKLPLTIRGSADLIPIEYQLPVASAQIKSAVLIAGLCRGETTVIEPEASRDHAERMRPFRRAAHRHQASGFARHLGQGRRRTHGARRAGSRRSQLGSVPAPRR